MQKTDPGFDASLIVRAPNGPVAGSSGRHPVRCPGSTPSIGAPVEQAGDGPSGVGEYNAVLFADDVDGLDEEAVSIRLPLRDAFRAPVERHGYRTPGSSRVVGFVATVGACSLVAAGFLTALGHLDPPATVPAPLIVSLLPLPSEVQPKPATEPTKVVPKIAAKPVPYQPPLPLPIVTPPSSPRAIAAPQPVAVDPAPPTAQIAPSPAMAAPPAPPVQSSRGPDKWEGRVLARLERFRRYPADAQHARQQGTAYIRFRIDRDGHVLSFSLERSSGYAALDDAALETLRRADPLPKIPPDRPDQAELLVPIEFSIAR